MPPSPLYSRITDFDDGSITNSGPPSPPTTTVLGLADMHIHSGLHSASSVSLASGYAGSVLDSASIASNSASVACDTVPPPQRLAVRSTAPSSPRPPSPPAPVESSLFQVPVLEHVEDVAGSSSQLEDDSKPVESKGIVELAPPGRKLCVRHQRMADEGMSSKLQRVS